jgi:hypothetical protein
MPVAGEDPHERDERAEGDQGVEPLERLRADACDEPGPEPRRREEEMRPAKAAHRPAITRGVWPSLATAPWAGRLLP